MPRCILAIALLVAPLASTRAADPSCDAIAARIEAQATQIMPRVNYAVTGAGRLRFYAAPVALCVTTTYVVPKDELIGYAEWHGWTSVMYTNPRTGQDSQGWVKADRLKARGTMGPAP